MTGVVAAQTIATVGLIIVALITALSTRANGKHIARVGQDVAEVRNQTQNSHESNLRVNIDVNHEATIAAIGQVRAEIATVRGDVGAVRGDLGGLHRDITGLHQADVNQQEALRQAVAEREHALTVIRREVTAKVAAHALGCPLLHNDPEGPGGK